MTPYDNIGYLIAKISLGKSSLFITCYVSFAMGHPRKVFPISIGFVERCCMYILHSPKHSLSAGALL